MPTQAAGTTSTAAVLLLVLQAALWAAWLPGSTAAPLAAVPPGGYYGWIDEGRPVPLYSPRPPSKVRTPQQRAPPPPAAAACTWRWQAELQALQTGLATCSTAVSASGAPCPAEAADATDSSGATRPATTRRPAAPAFTSTGTGMPPTAALS